MMRTARVVVIGFLLLSLTTIIQDSRVNSAQEDMGKEKALGSFEKSRSAEAAEAISSFLPTLEVAQDSCYVFLQPKSQSSYFGPLLRGEKIRWLDIRGDWVRVWIPRLRISGWVNNSQIRQTNEMNASPARIPEKLMTKVAVTANQANIRENSTTKSRILLVAEKNQEFWLLNIRDTWYQIWLSDLSTKGWVWGKNVTKHTKE